MTNLPTPDEPSIHTLKRKARNYERGVNQFLGDSKSVSEKILIKQGMPRYLWDEWQDSEVTYPALQSAVGDAGFRIEQWADGELTWSELIEYIRDRLS